MERLSVFANAGHLIANHSAEHADLHNISVEEFIQGIDLADQELKNFSNFRKWFRFPFLLEGKTPADVELVRAHLKKIGYMNGYVTVDSQDWFANELLVQGIEAGKKFHRQRLCDAYTDPIAQTEPASTTNLNQGRVHALAKQSGYAGPFFSQWNEEENIEKEFIRRKIWK